MGPIASGACVVGRIRIRDRAKWQVYLDAVPATIAAFDGVVVARGSDPVVLAGASPETDVVVLRFPSVEAVDAWYGSDAYQALIPLRDAAADVVLVRYRV